MTLHSISTDLSPARRFLVGLVCLGLIAGAWLSPVWAQSQVSFTAQVDKTTLSSDDTLVLTLAVEGELTQLPQPQLPILEGFAVVGSSRSTQFSMVNGVTSMRGEFVYRLQPTAVGSHTIGAATVQIDGVTYQTDPITVEVVAGQAPAQPTPTPPGPSDGGPGGKDLFVEAEVDDPSPFVGQQIVYRFRFYQATGVDLLDQPRATWPSFSGFWAEQISPQDQYYQKIGQRQYGVIEVGWALFATAVGQVTIEPAELSIPASFFNRAQQLRTEPVVVDVQPLPEGAPPDFAGAVGQYEMSAWLEPGQTRVNEPVTLFVQVSGSGNLNALPEPDWPELPGWRAYDPQVTTDLRQMDGLIQGERLYERLLVPREAGDYDLAPFSLSYYDPVAGAYRRAETEPLTVRVEPGEASADLPPPAGDGKEDVTLLASDIRHIKLAPPALATRRRSLLGQPLYWLGWLAPLLAVVGTWVWKRRRARLRGDVAYARARRAHRLARKRLTQARRLLDRSGNEREAVYGATSQALIGYLGDKFNLAPAGLTRDAIRQNLSQAGVDPALTARLFDCLDWADSGRFAPVAAGRGASALVDEAEGLVADLENQLRNRPK